MKQDATITIGIESPTNAPNVHSLILRYVDGRLDKINNNQMEEVMQEYVQHGNGIVWSQPHSFYGIESKHCDAVYVYLPDYEIYVPKYLFISKPK